MIPRRSLFAPPESTGHAISPDGSRVAWLAPFDGMMNVWVSPTRDPARGRPLTCHADRGVGFVRWACDGSHVFFSRDVTGAEGWHVFAVPADGGAERDLTPDPRERSFLAATSRARPRAALLMVTGPNSPYPDWQEVDVHTGARTVAFRNVNFTAVAFDGGFRPVAATRPTTDGGSEIMLASGADGGWHPFRKLDATDARSTCVVRVSPDGGTAYTLSSVGRDALALVSVDVATGRETVLAEADGADVTSYLPSAEDARALAYVVSSERPRTMAIDPGLQGDVAALDAALGSWAVTSRSDDDCVWTVVGFSESEPSRTWLYERATGRIAPLSSTPTSLQDVGWATTRTVSIPTRDGLSMVSYLTIPRDADTSQASAACCPLVMLVHGGPWDREHHGFNPVHQWLADRGYASLSPNFRGSSGFGKAFMAAGDLQWGAAMDDDLEDAVAWTLARHPTLDPARVAIMGTSYGGYAVLAAMVRRPEAYACGVAVSGPGDLVTLLSSLPPFWAAERAMMTRAVGDPGTPEGLAMLRERSPVHQADRISRPLLIAHGDHDPRVRRSESDRMMAAMEANGTRATYVTFPDEGHFISRPSNIDALNATVEAFLARHLGGRAEPQDPEMRATASMRLERVDALAEAS